MMRGNDRGTVIQKSYVSSMRIDENGRRVEEKYFNNNIAQRGEDGNTVKYSSYKKIYCYGVRFLKEEKDIKILVWE